MLKKGKPIRSEANCGLILDWLEIPSCKREYVQIDIPQNVNRSVGGLGWKKVLIVNLFSKSTWYISAKLNHTSSTPDLLHNVSFQLMCWVKRLLVLISIRFRTCLKVLQALQICKWIRGLKSDQVTDAQLTDCEINAPFATPLSLAWSIMFSSKSQFLKVCCC